MSMHTPAHKYGMGRGAAPSGLRRMAEQDVKRIVVRRVPFKAPAEAMDAWAHQGYLSPAFHYMVDGQGRTHAGRSPATPAATEGDLNGCSITVALLAGVVGPPATLTRILTNKYPNAEVVTLY